MQNMRLTAQWTENVSNYKIEQFSLYLTWQYFKYTIRFIGRS